MRTNHHRISARILAAGLTVGGLFYGLTATALVPKEEGTPLKLISFAVDLGASSPSPRRLGLPGARRAGTVEISIDRWSSDQERDSLLDKLRTQGENSLLSSLQGTERVGSIRTPDRLGWDLHYAKETPTDDGGKNIVIATDRPIRFWEAANLTRTMQYPFTVIEIHLDKDGKGEGRMSVATKVAMSKDGKTLELENYSSQPVLLEKVAEQR
ncbi:MAG TPA: hypothetical protein VGS07_17075 [Thermoanaerobaculia bacterium]|jgi:hypothetical protein|nr:hypothetical protein [Thermoanaerobaculia bacterium]